jgi:hypothetical protein
MKLPRAVRKMTVADFEKTYGGSLERVAESAARRDVERTIAEARTGAAKRARAPEAGAVPCTPGAKTGGRFGLRSARKGEAGVPQTPATVRAPRRGETMLSENGSPIAQEDMVVATVKKAKKEGGAAAPSIALELDAGTGTFLDLSAPGAVEGMDASMKKTAVSKLKSLQDEVAALMAQLNS